jgi:hypothetical protein
MLDLNLATATAAPVKAIELPTGKITPAKIAAMQAQATAAAALATVDAQTESDELQARRLLVAINDVISARDTLSNAGQWITLHALELLNADLIESVQAGTLAEADRVAALKTVRHSIEHWKIEGGKVGKPTPFIMSCLERLIEAWIKDYEAIKTINEGEPITSKYWTTAVRTRLLAKKDGLLSTGKIAKIADLTLLDVMPTLTPAEKIGEKLEIGAMFGENIYTRYIESTKAKKLENVLKIQAAADEAARLLLAIDSDSTQTIYQALQRAKELPQNIDSVASTLKALKAAAAERLAAYDKKDTATGEFVKQLQAGYNATHYRFIEDVAEAAGVATPARLDYIHATHRNTVINRENMTPTPNAEDTREKWEAWKDEMETALLSALYLEDAPAIDSLKKAINAATLRIDALRQAKGVQVLETLAELAIKSDESESDDESESESDDDDEQAAELEKAQAELDRQRAEIAEQVAELDRQRAEIAEQAKEQHRQTVLNFETAPENLATTNAATLENVIAQAAALIVAGTTTRAAFDKALTAATKAKAEEVKQAATA